MKSETYPAMPWPFNSDLPPNPIRFAETTLPEAPFTLYAVVDATGTLTPEGHGAAAFHPCNVYLDGNEAHDNATTGERVVAFTVSAVRLEPQLTPAGR